VTVDGGLLKMGKFLDGIAISSSKGFVFSKYVTETNQNCRN